MNHMLQCNFRRTSASQVANRGCHWRYKIADLNIIQEKFVVELILNRVLSRLEIHLLFFVTSEYCFTTSQSIQIHETEGSGLDGSIPNFLNAFVTSVTLMLPSSASAFKAVAQM